MLFETMEAFQVPEFVTDMRSFRFLDMALFDIVLTVLFGIIMSEKLVSKQHRHRVYWSLIPASIMAHVIFNQNTTLTREFCAKNTWVVGLFIFCLVKTVDHL